jgi:hypothetical protein
MKDKNAVQNFRTGKCKQYWKRLEARGSSPSKVACAQETYWGGSIAVRNIQTLFGRCPGHVLAGTYIFADVSLLFRNYFFLTPQKCAEPRHYKFLPDPHTYWLEFTRILIK